MANNAPWLQGFSSEKSPNCVRFRGSGFRVFRGLGVRGLGV